MIHADSDFRERIARINQGKQFEAENIIGHRSMKVYIKAKKRGKFDEKPKANVVTELIVTPLALLFGALAVVVARVGWYQMVSRQIMPSQIADFGARGEIVLAALVAVVFLLAFGFLKRLRPLALIGGFALMAFGENAFAETAPTLWTFMFSPGYFAEVVQGATLAAALL